MAIRTQRAAGGEFFNVTMTYDDVTGAISAFDWTVTSGVLTVTAHRDGQPDLTDTVTTDGHQNVPAGYNLTLTPKGTWAWEGPISFETSWSAV